MSYLLRLFENETETVVIPNPLILSGTITFSGSYSLVGSNIPSVDDGAALGSTSYKWSDLFLASGAVINFNSGDVTITHSSNALAFAGASSGYSFDNAVSLSAGTLSFAGQTGQCILVGASSSSPILVSSTGTTNIVEVNAKLTSASGIIRGIISYLEFSGTQVSTATNVYAVRGYTKVSGTAADSNFYACGLQGKIELSGTITGGKHAAIIAQLNSSDGVTAATGGTIYCLWADGMQISQTPASALHMVGIGIELPDAATRFDSALYVYGKATNLFELEGNNSSYISGSSTKSTPSGVDNWITIDIDGSARYIPCYASKTA